jgi:hypothetical protein
VHQCRVEAEVADAGASVLLVDLPAQKPRRTSPQPNLTRADAISLPLRVVRSDLLRDEVTTEFAEVSKLVVGGDNRHDYFITARIASTISPTDGMWKVSSSVA